MINQMTMIVIPCCSIGTYAPTIVLFPLKEDHPMKIRIVGAGALALVLSATLTACGSSGGSDATGDTGKLNVVASTNVWGDIANQVGGSRIDVTSLLTSPDQDPHSFEANPKTALAISKARVVIENGGGYDDYMDTLLKASGSKATVINAVKVSGKTAPQGGELNEHVFYDFPTVKLMANTIAADLGKADPTYAAEFTKNAATFNTSIDKLIDREGEIKTAAAGTPIAITEPVPLYMTAAVGLVNKTPAKFSEAIEEGDDMSATVLDETLALYRDKKVKALVYNEQTSGPVTEKVKAAAKRAGIAIVPVTETLPTGDDYLEWMSSNLGALATAVSKG